MSLMSQEKVMVQVGKLLIGLWMTLVYKNEAKLHNLPSTGNNDYFGQQERQKERERDSERENNSKRERESSSMDLLYK